jgi:hypothetical protein
MPLCGFNTKMLYGSHLFNEGLIEQGLLGGIKMPICGFNTDMLYGTALFNEGLVEHGIIDRSVAKGKSLEQIFANELSEMEEFLKEIPNIESNAFKDIIQGVTLHARGIYSLLTPKQIRSGSYRFTLKQVSDTLYGMDNEYYSKLETQPERMKKLVGWINNYLKENK